MKIRENSEITIWRGSEDIISVPITDKCMRRYRLMEQDCITIEFYSDIAIEFGIEDYINDEVFGRYYIAKPQKYEYSVSAGRYYYNLTFEAEYMLFRNYQLMYVSSPVNNLMPQAKQRKEASWSYTANLAAHADVIIENLKILGYGSYSIVIEPSAKQAIYVKYEQYNGISIFDALGKLAEDYSCEWWVNGYEIHFGKCESSKDPIEIDTHADLTAININDNRNGYANILYAYGSDKNIPANYRKELYLTIDTISKTSNRIAKDSTKKLTPGMFVKFKTFEATIDGAGLVDKNGTRGWDDQWHVYTKTFEALKYTTEYAVIIPDYQFSVMSITAESAGTMTFNIRMYIKYASSQSADSATIGTVKRNVIAGDNGVYDNVFNIKGGKYMLSVEKDKPFQIAIEVSISGVQGVYNYPGFMFGESRSTSVKFLPNNGGGVAPIMFKYAANGVEQLGISANLGGDGYLSVPSTVAPSFQFAKGMVIKITSPSARVPSAYYTDSLSDPSSVASIGSRRLMLPASTGGYIGSKSLPLHSHIEQTIVFEDIYPKMHLFVESIYVKHRKDTDEYEGEDNVTYWNWSEYTINLKDANGNRFEFDKDWLTENELQLQFLSPDDVKDSISTERYNQLVNGNQCRLAGMIFGAAYEADDYYNQSGFEHAFTIVRNNDFGAMLPNETLLPMVGDPVTLIGINIRVLESSSIVTSAENELKSRAEEYMTLLNTNPYTFELTITPDRILNLEGEGDTLITSDGKTIKDSESRGIKVINSNELSLLTQGQRVDIIDDSLTDGHCLSRVIGYEYKLDIPWDNPKVVVGDTQAYSRLAQIEKQITKL